MGKAVHPAIWAFLAALPITAALICVIGAAILWLGTQGYL